MLSEIGVVEDSSPAGCSRYVVGKTVLDVAKESAAFIFRAKQSGKEGGVHFWNYLVPEANDRQDPAPDR
jgi:hypothetical protein